MSGLKNGQETLDDPELDDLEFVRSTSTFNLGPLAGSLPPLPEAPRSANPSEAEHGDILTSSIDPSEFIVATLPCTEADFLVDTPRLTEDQNVPEILHTYVVQYCNVEAAHIEWLLTSVDLDNTFVGLFTVFSYGAIVAVLITTRKRCLFIRVSHDDGLPMDSEARKHAREEKLRAALDASTAYHMAETGEDEDVGPKSYRDFQLELLRKQTRGDGGIEPNGEPYNKVLELLLCNEEVAKVGWEVWFSAVALYQFFNHKTASAYEVRVLTPVDYRGCDVFETLRQLYPNARDPLGREFVPSDADYFSDKVEEYIVRAAALEVWAAYMCAVAADRVDALRDLIPLDHNALRETEPREFSESEPKIRQNSIQCMHEKRPPLSLIRVPQWQLDMCAQASVLARTVQEYSKRKFEGDIIPGRVSVTQSGDLNLRNDRYVTRIRAGDTVLIRTASGDVLKGHAHFTSGKTVSVRLQDQSPIAIAAGPVIPEGLSSSSSAARSGSLHAKANGSEPGERRKRGSQMKASVIEVVSVEVEVGQLDSNADMARDCFAKDLLTGAKTTLTPMIEMFFGDAEVFRAAKAKLNNCGLYRLPSPPAAQALKAADAAACSRRKQGIEKELRACSDCGRLNKAQYYAAQAIMVKDDPIVLIQGPPGSGKTSCIVAAIVAWHMTRPTIDVTDEVNDETLLVVAQSNVAVKNIAEKLERETHVDFKVVVSTEFYKEWHESQYVPVAENTLVMEDVPGKTSAKRAYKSEKQRIFRERMRKVHVILCTLALLANGRMIDVVLNRKRVTHFLVDEASQIPNGMYLDPFSQLPHLRKAAFFGDDFQLPPYGDAIIRGGVPSVFSTRHREKAHFLNTQYRMPAVIAKFVSKHVYSSFLKSDPKRPVLPESDGPELLWVDVSSGLGEVPRGTSFENPAEAEAIAQAVAGMVHGPPFLAESDYVVLAGYDAQRKLIQDKLHDVRPPVPYQRHSYCVDSYQGHECHTVLISLTRTTQIGFLQDMRRLNVMLTRAKVRMILFGRLVFAVGSKGRKTLVGKLGLECREKGLVISDEDLLEPNWLTTVFASRKNARSDS